MRNQKGFTLLEVLVATAIMGVAIAGILGALNGATRNAARLNDYDRATLRARSKMDELLANQSIPRRIPVEGTFDATSGWTAQVIPYESTPGAGPGSWVVDRIQLEVWWKSSDARHSFALEAFRRAMLQPGDKVELPR